MTFFFWFRIIMAVAMTIAALLLCSISYTIYKRGAKIRLERWQNSIRNFFVTRAQHHGQQYVAVPVDYKKTQWTIFDIRGGVTIAGFCWPMEEHEAKADAWRMSTGEYQDGPETYAHIYQ